MKHTEAIVYLLDDEPAVLKAVGRLLRSAGYRTEEYTDGAMFLKSLRPDACGCLVLDYALQDLNGLEVQDELHRRGATLTIVFLTGRADVPMSVRAMKAGAAEFLTKPIDERLLLEAVREALERNRLERGRLDELTEANARLATLTPRERQVMELVVAGKLNKQVAQVLGTAEKTVKVHRARVMEKTGSESLADLVRLAAKAAKLGSD